MFDDFPVCSTTWIPSVRGIPPLCSTNGISALLDGLSLCCTNTMYTISGNLHLCPTNKIIALWVKPHLCYPNKVSQNDVIPPCVPQIESLHCGTIPCVFHNHNVSDFEDSSFVFHMISTNSSSIPSVSHKQNLWNAIHLFCVSQPRFPSIWGDDRLCATNKGSSIVKQSPLCFSNKSILQFR